MPSTSQDISRFIGGNVNEAACSTTGNVYFFKIPTENISPTVGFKALEDVVKKHEAIPSRAEALARARQKIAMQLTSDEKPTTLAELRLRAGYSQSKLALAIGNSQPSYSLIEMGRHDIMFTTFEKLVNILGVTRDELAQAVKNTKQQKG
jgi:DNA-binding XRE family transcriptional regulator